MRVRARSSVMAAVVSATCAFAGGAACDGGHWPDGKYLYVDGREAQLQFDRVELFFGKRAGGQLPSYLPSGYDPKADEQVLLKRVLEQYAAAQAVALGDQVDLYLTPGDVEESGAGEYVMVIAWRGDAPVGIGEYIGF